MDSVIFTPNCVILWLSSLFWALVWLHSTWIRHSYTSSSLVWLHENSIFCTQTQPHFQTNIEHNLVNFAFRSTNIFISSRYTYYALHSKPRRTFFSFLLLLFVVGDVFPLHIVFRLFLCLLHVRTYTLYRIRCISSRAYCLYVGLCYHFGWLAVLLACSLLCTQCSRTP